MERVPHGAMVNYSSREGATFENLRLANHWYGIDLMAALFTMPP